MNALPPPGPAGTIYFFSNTVPTEDSGSFIIFRRHLLPFVEAGWKLKVFTYCDSPPPPLFWEHLRLPHRRAWWPPARPQWLWSQRLRARLMLRYLRSNGWLEDTGPRVLLTNLWDNQALFAAQLAETGFARLGVFVHDDEIAWNASSLPRRYLEWFRKTVVTRSSRTWAVSGRLVSQMPAIARPRCRVLRPIPGVPPGRGAWRPAFARGVTLGYAGKIYPGMSQVLAGLVRQLEALDGALTIITQPETAANPPLRSPRIEWRPFFPDPTEAARWLLERCTALLVAHPGHGPRTADGWQMLSTSFPSKLVEYAQFALPLVLIGATDSEFSDWASAHPEIPYFTDVKCPRLRDYLRSLRTEACWQEASVAAHRLAATEFNPKLIQAQFATDMVELGAPA